MREYLELLSRWKSKQADIYYKIMALPKESCETSSSHCCRGKVM
jgi:hypothetical protein